MGEVRAGERAARRILAGASGLLIVGVVVVNASVVTAGPASSFPVWYVLLTTTSAAVTCAAGLAAPVLDIGGLRTMTGVSVVLYGAVVLLLPVAAAGGDVGRMPWMVTASSAAVAAALVAGDIRLGWATAGLGAVAGVVYRLRFGGFDLDGIVNDSHALLTAAVICVIGAHVISVGAGLDQAASARRAAAARESAERGRLAARTQAAALVHDEVLATLALAASDLPVPRDRLAAQARRAVSMVTRLVEDGADEPLSLEVALAAEARRHGAAFEASVDASTAASDVVRTAVVGATRQALGNAVRHAAGAGLTLRLRVAQGVIEVEIADAGRGFDPAAVADDRLGIRQSIVGRMSRLPGGSALVRSAPGEGTLIRLRVAPEPIPEVESAGDQRTLRRGIVVIGVVFVVLQTLCAAAAAIAAPGTWPTQALLLAGVLVTAALLPRTPTRAPAWGWSVLVTGLVVGGTAFAVATASFTYGPLWAVVAFSFLLVALGLRGRTGTALVGGLLVAAVVTTGGIAAGASAGQILQLNARPALLVAVAVVLLTVVERMQRRIAALHRDALSDAESESWSLAARAELSERTDELARTVVPVLARIAEARPGSEADRSEYAAWEGRLRDGLRAGALSRDPLRAAVAEARGRGVDVVLLDDTGGHLPDATLEPVLAWMADAVAQARHRVVGRLHPPGRETWASVAVDGRRLVFDGGAQGASISFQGE